MENSERRTTGIQYKWDPNEKFPRTYSMFALLIVAVFAGQSFCEYFKIILIVAVYLMFYIHAENKISDVMKKMATSSSYFRSTPYFLIPYFFLLLGASVSGMYILDIRVVPDDHFFSCYMVSLLQSLIIFQFAAALKCFLLGTGIASFKLTRRGFFGIFQRIFIIIRNIVVIAVWVGYFTSVSPRSLEELVNAKKSFWCTCYLVLKCFLQLWLLYDLGTVIHDYSLNKRASYRHLEETEKRPKHCHISSNENKTNINETNTDINNVNINDSSNTFISDHCSSETNEGNDVNTSKFMNMTENDDEDDEEDCIICQDKPEEPIVLSCGHIFCYKCVYRWFKDHNTCPVCRTEIMEQKIIEFSDGCVPFTTLLCTF